MSRIVTVLRLGRKGYEENSDRSRGTSTARGPDPGGLAAFRAGARLARGGTITRGVDPSHQERMRHGPRGDGARRRRRANRWVRRGRVRCARTLSRDGLAKVGFVKGAGSVSAAEPRQTSNGSSYHTDGLRAVLVFGGKAVSLAEIDFFDWERPIDHDRRQLAAAPAP